MARLPRLSAPGLPHLVLQTGHGGGIVAADAVDAEAFVAAFAESARTEGVALHAYAVGERRIVLLATPARAEGLSRAMQQAGRRHTLAFNRRHGRGGTLWGGRFRAAVIEPGSWLVAAMRHLESDAAGPAWRSSADHHLGRQVDRRITEHPAFWALGNTPFEREAAYRALLAQPLPAAQAAAIEHAMAHGWALGSPAFLSGLAETLARPVQPRRAGRPRRESTP